MTIKKFGIILFLAMLLVSMAFVPAVNGRIEESSNKITMENSVSYSDAELEDLYSKYNISENDIKFANGELPNYLEGTILHSNKRVVASDTGKPHENLKEGENYDVLITTNEMFSIIDNAREKYIKLYGVDPANPKLEEVNGYFIPKEEVKKLVERGVLSYKSEDISTELGTELQIPMSVTTNPRAINGVIDMHIFVATDSPHTPTESIEQDTSNALSRFENFGITVYKWWYWNSWDASDVSPMYNSSSVLNDLVEDESWVRYAANDMVLGWTHELDNNGIAKRNGAYAVCSDTVGGIVYLEWPHDSIVQHEVSHNFNAIDQNSISHPQCIMNYAWANDGTNIWCSSCWNTVNGGIYN